MTRKNKIYLYGGISLIGIGYLIYNQWSKKLFYEEMLKRIGGGSIRFDELKIWDSSFLTKLKATDKSFVEYQQSFLNEQAEKIRKATKGLGTDESTIYSVFEKFSSKAGLSQLVQFYNAKYGLSLKDELNSDLFKSEKNKLAVIISQKPDVIYL